MRLVRRGDLWFKNSSTTEWLQPWLLVQPSNSHIQFSVLSLSFVVRRSFVYFSFSFFFLSFCLRISNECRAQNETKRIVSLAAQCLCRSQWLTNNEPRLCATCFHQFYSKTRNDRAILFYGTMSLSILRFPGGPDAITNCKRNMEGI